MLLYSERNRDGIYYQVLSYHHYYSEFLVWYLEHQYRELFKDEFTKSIVPSDKMEVPRRSYSETMNSCEGMVRPKLWLGIVLSYAPHVEMKEN